MWGEGLDRYDSAIDYLRAAIRNAPKFPMNYMFMAAAVSALNTQMPYALERNRQKVDEGLKAAGLPD